MARYKNTGDLYVGKHGSDANPGTDPTLPKLTIAGAIAVAATDDIIVVGDGLYEENSFTFLTDGSQTNITILGDSLVIIEGDNIADMITSRVDQLTLENVVIINHSNVINLSGATGAPIRILFDNSTIINSPIFVRKGSGTSAVYSIDSEFINSNFDVITSIQNLTQAFGISPIIDRSIFINSTLLSNNEIKNTVCESDVVIDNTDVVPATNSVYADSDFTNFNSNITYETVLYADIEALQSANPTVLQNCINQDSLFNRITGESQTLDFTVQGSSPLLGAGENGTNIGGVRRGLPQSRLSASVQNGTNTNIVFDGNVWQVQSGQTTGSIETDVIDFGLTVKSPKLTIKGLVNFLDNVPDFDNTLLDPNKLDIEARYAIIGEDISVATYKPFLLNERMLLDVGGNTNGETGFDWANTVTIPMKEIQLRITLRQDYAES